MLWNKVGGQKSEEVRSWKSEDRSKKENNNVTLENFKMEFKFEKLIIWQKSMDFGETINKLAFTFPNHEIYNLSSQIRRAVDSIALNISEGLTGQSDLEFKKFIGYSIRSLAEVITCLHKAKRRSYLTEDEFLIQYEFAYNLMNMLVAFRKNIK